MLQSVFLLTFLLVAVVYSYDSNFDLSLAQRYVKMCGVSYCANPTFGKDKVASWTCKACNSFPNTNASTFFAAGLDANGFVGYDADANEIIIAFAGTNPLSIRNWIDDLNYFQTNYPLCSGCKVHQGFYATYNSVESQVKKLVASYHSAHPSATIAITGHSLGAAMAALCAGDLVTSGYSIKTLYTYGMPRVGDNNFQNWYKSGVIGGTFRVTHGKDPVPQLPFEWMQSNFHHMPYEVFYTSDYNKWKLCNFEGEDQSCSNQYILNLDVLMHLNYMGFDFTNNFLTGC